MVKRKLGGRKQIDEAEEVDKDQIMDVENSKWSDQGQAKNY